MVLFPEKGSRAASDSGMAANRRRAADRGMADPWDSLVRRIMTAAGPELERLRKRVTLTGQFDRWMRSLMPLAAALILVLGFSLAWVGSDPAGEAAEAPLIAEALVPEQLGLWLEAGASFTLAEFVEVLEEGGR